VFPGVEDRARYAIELSRLNVENASGGPFGAAIFESGTGRLVAAGVNMVVPARCSLLHAEMVALALAQRIVGSHDLGAVGCFELVASSEPCAMCLGAIPWSGVAGLVCGARDCDVRAIGFVEGLKPRQWVQEMRRCGIRVQRDVCRGEADAVLKLYQAKGGALYNASTGSSASGVEAT
jgi:tRNA(Arg) A34 adenosine deaminase TadA